ncbi:hypothetical protein KA005_05370 [bacterium]|nr:hypothetical protein [bacterium]
MKEISIREVMYEIEALDRELWRSRLKCIIELLASSFILIFGVGIYFGKIHFSMPLNAILTILPVLNATAWLIWVMPSTLMFNRVHFDFDESWRDDLGDMGVLKRYEMRLYSLSRQKKSERMIDLITAMQFIVLAITVAVMTLIR